MQEFTFCAVQEKSSYMRLEEEGSSWEKKKHFMSGIDFLFECGGKKHESHVARNQLIHLASNKHIRSMEKFFFAHSLSLAKKLKQTMNLWNREEISKLNVGYFSLSLPPRPFPSYRRFMLIRRFHLLFESRAFVPSALLRCVRCWLR